MPDVSTKEAFWSLANEGIVQVEAIAEELGMMIASVSGLRTGAYDKTLTLMAVAYSASSQDVLTGPIFAEQAAFVSQRQEVFAQL